ncbi:MAG: hypothetical protein ACPL28_05615 [bacterium]
MNGKARFLAILLFFLGCAPDAVPSGDDATSIDLFNTPEAGTAGVTIMIFLRTIFLLHFTVLIIT